MTMATVYEPNITFSLAVQNQSKVPIRLCYFCQKCTAGCPVAYAMDYKPVQVLRLIQLEQQDVVLNSSAIWLCVGCEICGTRCPFRIRLAPVFDTLRYMSLEKGYQPEPAVYALHRSFLDSIRLWGRVHELSMLLEYRLRIRDLFSDLPMGIELILKRKLAILPERIWGLSQVRKLYKKTAGYSYTEVKT
jgi:heterodisulfide reductase subunit C